MRTVRFILFILLGFPSLLTAQSWPDNPNKVRALFGQPTDGNFERGMEFEAEGQRVTAWADGEIIWNGASLLNSDSPGGQFVVIEHEKGFRTSYQNLDSRPDITQHVSRGDWLGYSGSGTWRFQIMDIMQSKIIDPLLLLPNRAMDISDNLKVYLNHGGGMEEVKDGLFIRPGTISLMLEGTAPREISLYWLGRQINSLRLETLTEKNGGIAAETPAPAAFEDIHDSENRLILRNISLSSGMGLLELRILNKQNKKYSLSWKVTVQDT
ncbi:MAG: hypothetical protein B0D92_05595 [Spirochaeta sp. LUC14_002_19_P3]|nr:MAG: hypothetical protein B0D92_05595 [Spirochaeta sp. LUC14_002_19_P3]